MATSSGIDTAKPRCESWGALPRGVGGWASETGSGDQTPAAESAAIAEFTVCADPELSALAQEASRRFPGVIFAGGYCDYITAGRNLQFSPEIRDAPSALAFIDFDRDPDRAVETAAAFRDTSSARILSVGIASKMDAALLLRAMRAGCSEFLEKPVTPSSFRQTMERLRNRVRCSSAAGKRGRIVSLFAAKGGVGATTLAVHLAINLQAIGKKTLLIDDHYQLGHASLYLNLKPTPYHYGDLIHNTDHLDANLLKGFVAIHKSGLEMLGSPEACALPRDVPAEDVAQALEFLRTEYEMIVIDGSLTHGGGTAATLKASDEVCLITAPSLAAVRDLSRHLESLSAIDAGRKRIILNRALSSDTIGPEAIANAVRMPVDMSIPNSYVEVMRAINSGEPIVPGRRSAFSAQMGQWAGRIAAVNTAATGIPGVARKKFFLWARG